jgi:hypothetical protein
MIGPVFAYLLTTRSVMRLPYLTFIANNPSLRPSAASTP